jgi:competence protein ComEC
VKLPAVAIATLFACGIALGLCPPVARQATSRFLLVSGLAATALLILAAILLVAFERLTLGFAAGLLSWVVLGVTSAWIAEQPLPENHVVTLIAENRLDLHSPLKWHGRLRDEPTKLPWGAGYEMELTGVDYHDAWTPLVGGMRLSFIPHPGEPAPASAHAGDEITVLAQAKRPPVFRDEGAFDRRAYLASQDIDLVATLRAPELLERLSEAKPTALTVLARTRRRLRDEVDTLFGAKPQVAGALRAMLLGDRSFVEREEATDFQKTGVFHVLVVAGLHVGALAVFLFWIGRRLRLSPSWTIVFTLTLLFAYVAVIEQRPPVLRAALMAGIVVAGGFFYRRLEVLNSAAIAALVLLVARPLALRDSSFQLTFAAIGCVAGLALPWLGKTLEPYVKALRGWRDVTRDAAHEPLAAQFRIDLRAAARWISAWLSPSLAPAGERALVGGLALAFRVWELLVLTVCLQIGMLPLMARDFHRVALAAPVVNLVAVPLTGIVVPFGFLTLAGALLFRALGKVLALPLSWATLLLLRVVQWFAHFPAWSYRIPGPPVWVMVAFCIFAVLLGVAMRAGHSRQRVVTRVLAGGLAACALLIALFPFAPKWSPRNLEVTVLDVGQGDSLFVVSPRGKTLLIDGGGAFGGFPGQEQQAGVDPGEEAVSPYLWSRGYQRLDVVAVTHAHQDHLGGLTAILENFRVGQLWIGTEVASPALARLEALARFRHIPIEHEVRGRSFDWDGAEGSFFWPEPASTDLARTSAKNNDSLVLRLRYGDRAVLLPGDAEKEAEGEMITESGSEALRADVLKVGHHGSKNSSTPEFLSAVKPRLAIISSGEDNPYGHPSPELLERLKAAGVHTLRTDRDGAVQVLTDGERMQVKCFAGCQAVADEGSWQAQAPKQEKNKEQQ